MGALVEQLRAIVGPRHVLTGAEATRPFRTGYRFGSGPVAAVVRPGTLVELWWIAQACVSADHIVITQAANTGLTGGSTPDGEYDRPVVVVSTRRIGGIHLLRRGAQAVCLAGSTLNDLERMLVPLGREPHSVIGSSCIGASVIGGICNSSGGALVRRGPAYTEYAVFARVDAQGELTLENNLGLDLGSDPETILRRLDEGSFSDAQIVDDNRAASAPDYEARVRNVDSASPARFNADPDGLYEASGCAGRVIVFAVRVDTFPADQRSATFYIGTNKAAELAQLRLAILSSFRALPVSGEYIHRTAFDVAADYGKDIFLAIRFLGTSRLPALFLAKARIDRLSRRFRIVPHNLADRLMQALARLFPTHLPSRMLNFRDRFEHHLILKMPNDGIEEARQLLADMFPSDSGDMFECTPDEARKAFLHRFAVAGAAIRYRDLHDAEVEDLISLDIALPRNESDWSERLPPELDEQLVCSIYYGHFFCHVFHQDYLVRKGADVHALEQDMLGILDRRGAEYPAEHNVGHVYPAKPALVTHYRRLDPGNVLNPGIGQTSRNRGWADDCSARSTSHQERI